MFSPAALHRAKTQARPSQTAKPGLPHEAVIPVSHEQRVLRAQFQADQSRFAHIRSLKQRAAAKRQALPPYQSWINTMLTANVPCAPEEQRLWVWLLIWHLDSGLWETALDMAAYALQHDLGAPASFQRNLAEVVVDHISDGLKTQGHLIEQAALLERLATVVAEHDVHDVVLAKLYKARGLAQQHNNPVKALALLEQALTLHDRCGVKRHVQRLQKQQQAQLEAKQAEQQPVYTLSARACARLLGMTAPTFMKRVKQYPEHFPYVLIPNATRHFYRFNPKDIEAFKQKHLRQKT